MIADLLTLIGSLWFLIAAIGLHRMPDSFARIHASAKASSLGITFMAAAAIIKFPTLDTLFICSVIVFLVFLTAPVACQAIACRLLPTDSGQ